MEYEEDIERNSRNNHRGQSEGSRRNRFSKENQPSRRRMSRQRKSVEKGLLEHLNQSVTVTIRGQQKKLPLMQVFLQTFSQDILKAPLPEKLRVLAHLNKLGISVVQASEERLDQERRDFEEEQRTFREHRKLLEFLADSAEAETAEATAKWYAAAEALRQVSEHCACGACNTMEVDDIAWLLKEFEDDQEADRSTQELVELLRHDRLRESSEPARDHDDDDDIVDGNDRNDEDRDDNYAVGGEF